MAQNRTEKSDNTSRRSAVQGRIELFPVDGNTVRQARPLEKEPLAHNEELRRRRQAWEEEEREQRRARRVQRSRIRQMRVNRLYAVFLSVCVCALFGICLLYVQMQSTASAYKTAIAAATTQINELEADNEEMLQSIETSVDLAQIMERAMELGMEYPDADQVITYDADTSDTLTQYADVSSAASGSSVFSGIFGN